MSLVLSLQFVLLNIRLSVYLEPLEIIEDDCLLLAEEFNSLSFEIPVYECRIGKRCNGAVRILQHSNEIVPRNCGGICDGCTFHRDSWFGRAKQIVEELEEVAPFCDNSAPS